MPQSSSRAIPGPFILPLRWEPPSLVYMGPLTLRELAPMGEKVGSLLAKAANDAAAVIVGAGLLTRLACGTFFPRRSFGKSRSDWSAIHHGLHKCSSPQHRNGLGARPNALSDSRAERLWLSTTRRLPIWECTGQAVLKEWHLCSSRQDANPILLERGHPASPRLPGRKILEGVLDGARGGVSHGDHKALGFAILGLLDDPAVRERSEKQVVNKLRPSSPLRRWRVV
jgi:hypothetical protein